MSLPAGDVRVVLRHPHVLVLAKPTGLPTTAPDRRPSLVEEAQRLDPSAPRLHPTSRLDAEVTGLVVFARTRQGNASLLEARRRGLYRRLYLALAADTPAPEAGIWDAPIGLDPRDRRRRRAAREARQGSGPGVKRARTEYETWDRLEGACLLALRPATGRTHQLRVHAADAAVPLVGDVHYGGPRRLVRPDGSVVTARRTMLHCARLCVPVPDGASLVLTEPLPDDFRRVVAALGGDAEAIAERLAQA
jgi:23S rRNA-/tRNA-specific pseudouridylate synthase